MMIMMYVFLKFPPPKKHFEHGLKQNIYTPEI